MAEMARKSGGFTLLEVLIAVALSALLLITVYTTYFAIARSIDTTFETQELLETGRVLVQMIKRDIRGINAGRFPLISTTQDLDGKPATEISFVTSARSSTNPFNLTRVGYSLVQDTQGEPVLVRKEASNPKEDFITAGNAFEVSRLVSSFQLSFYNGTEWVDQWDSRSTGKLPKQVRITLELSDGKENRETITAEEGIPSAL
jgi:general secretion pathway protein J